MYLTISMKKLLCAAAVFLCILIPTVLVLQSREPAALETGAWGLSFQQKNQPPVADVSQEALTPYDARYIGNTEENTIYLTFDCGYEAGYTETILDVLAAHDAPAAFFVVGNFIESEPELVCRMAKEGHIVGNHTWSHPNMSQISDKSAFAEQLQKVADAYKACTGEEMPHYYRPPQGVYSQENLNMAQELGYNTVFWSLAYVDWKQDDQPTQGDALTKLTERIHNGAVVLLHNTSSTNCQVLDQVLTCWEEMGYEFGTLDELFAG